MNVKELIEKLKQFPTEMLVVVDGYEGGYDDIATVHQVKVKLNDPRSLFGQHSDEALEKDATVLCLSGVADKLC